MKKLMIAAVICAASALVHAASVTWSASDLVDNKGNTLTADYLVIGFYLTGSGTTANVPNTYTVEQAINLIQSKSAVATYCADYAHMGYNDGGIATAYADEGSGVDSGDIQTFMIVVDQSAATYMEYGTYNITKYSVIEGGSYDSTTIMSAADEANVSFGAGTQDDWVNLEPVPEPFSGSLALLGMGVLALRRKLRKAKKA